MSLVHDIKRVNLEFDVVRQERLEQVVDHILVGAVLFDIFSFKEIAFQKGEGQFVGSPHEAGSIGVVYHFYV